MKKDLVSAILLDIHQETVVVCVRRHQGQGRAQLETRTFGTATSQWIDLADG